MQTIRVKLDRNMVAQGLYGSFPMINWVNMLKNGIVDPRKLPAKSPADWQAQTVDVGWGEGCMLELYEEEILQCAGIGSVFLPMFSRWEVVLREVGLYEESFQLAVAYVSGKDAYAKLCGFSQDE